jgi:hypothetical protein
MTNQQTHKHDAGVTDVIGSMMGVATASTRFTWRQMQNAMGICVGSQSAWNNVRDSLERVRDAMAKSPGDSGMDSRTNMRSSEPQNAEEAFTGRKV